MEIIDTHAHIYLKDFKNDINEIINRASDLGVSRILMPNIDSDTIDDMLELEYKFPDICVPMMGLHPCSVDKNFEKELYIVDDWLKKKSFCAVGEMGLDFYWDKTTLKYQEEAFRIQCQLAIQYDLPIVIHSREATQNAINLVTEFKDDNIRGVFHCFTGSENEANEIIDLNFCLGIGGVVTFKNGGLDNFLNQINLKQIVLETDSPYLSPTPNRGKRNEPYNLLYIYKKLQELYNKSEAEILQSTSDNARDLFLR